MKTLVTYAVEAEFAPWRTLLQMEKVVIEGVAAHRTQVGRARVDFVATGIGMGNAQRVAEAVISQEYSFCIVSGFAGALRSSCKLGDVIAAERVQPNGTGRTAVCSRNLVKSAKQDG